MKQNKTTESETKPSLGYRRGVYALPKVIETKSTWTEEEQNENPLNRRKLPEGFKTAEQITKVDELEHECGRLRSLLTTFSGSVMIDGKTYSILVDPLNMTVELLGSKPKQTR